LDKRPYKRTTKTTPPIVWSVEANNQTRRGEIKRLPRPTTATARRLFDYTMIKPNITQLFFEGAG